MQFKKLNLFQMNYSQGQTISCSVLLKFVMEKSGAFVGRRQGNLVKCIYWSTFQIKKKSLSKVVKCQARSKIWKTREPDQSDELGVNE